MSHGRRIGRVKLIIPTPEVQEKYFLHWNSKDLYYNPEIYPEISGAGLFHSSQAIHLEIGCGTGEYLVGLAKSNPNELYVGIETSTRSIYYAIDLAQKNDLNNIRFIQADFKNTYKLIPDKTFKNIILHFPDPNYGKKHLKHRIFDQEFLDKMDSALISEGLLSIVTDQEEFFFDMLKIAESDPRFTKTHEERFLNDFNSEIKSRFQRAWERFASPIFRFELAKKDISE